MRKRGEKTQYVKIAFERERMPAFLGNLKDVFIDSQGYHLTIFIIQPDLYTSSHRILPHYSNFQRLFPFLH